LKIRKKRGNTIFQTVFHLPVAITFPSAAVRLSKYE
jgi:hypothetical protein